MIRSGQPFIGIVFRMSVNPSGEVVAFAVRYEQFDLTEVGNLIGDHPERPTRCRTGGSRLHHSGQGPR